MHKKQDKKAGRIIKFPQSIAADPAEELMQMLIEYCDSLHDLDNNSSYKRIKT